MEASKGRIRADRAHEKQLALSYAGAERSTRRAIAQVKAAWRLGHTRIHRLWITEPGMWLQYDFGDGPRIGGVKTILFERLRSSGPLLPDRGRSTDLRPDR
ncbi:hypothetical protein J2T10_001786 [Paenarthrobacter nicotinovorans]|uniref:Transposase n=1 Tax=Paenarthrobacter nicotinovorans TaxID=29320 RepID=A0ABT9TKG6_PAENI|nr:hypothetical protein [Paenarthrobacter nicotinovorans]GAT87992.1 transposase [Paenarthrobacter nicotinovorans]